MKLNQQPIEKRVSRTDGAVEVHSVFHTIQGEGPFCGTPCVFVRLTGCNLQCPACDTEYTSTREILSPQAVLQRVIDLMPARGLVVITGGEPFRQNLTALLTALTDRDYYVQIETNGTLAPSFFYYEHQVGFRSGVFIVCSPKAGKVNSQIWQEACCVKYVMEEEDQDDDGLPVTALMHRCNPRVARPPKGWNRPVYLQPMDCKDEEQNMRNIIAVRDSCMKHGHIMQLQIHKIIGVE